MTPIDSRSNPGFRRWLKLAMQPRAARELGATLAEGVHLAEVAIEAGWAVRSVLTRRGVSHAGVLALAARAERSGARRHELAAALYDEVAGVERGVGLVLEVALPPPAIPPAQGDVLCLDGVQDPGNVGALLRVAAAAGVGTVLATSGTAALWSPKVLRAAQGAHARLRLAESVEIGAIGAWHAGPWIGADAHGATPLWALPLPDRAAVGWLVGAEGGGLSAAALAACSARTVIPLAPGVESLNVAAAAAVCLFERRRRLAAAGG